MKKLTLYYSSRWVGCEAKETIPLSEYGISDEEWDAMSEKEKEKLLEQWAQEYADEHHEFGAYVE